MSTVGGRPVGAIGCQRSLGWSAAIVGSTIWLVGESCYAVSSWSDTEAGGAT